MVRDIVYICRLVINDIETLSAFFYEVKLRERERERERERGT